MGKEVHGEKRKGSSLDCCLEPCGRARVEGKPPGRGGAQSEKLGVHCKGPGSPGSFEPMTRIPSLEANRGTLRSRGCGQGGCIPGTPVRWGCLPLEPPEGLRQKAPWSWGQAWGRDSPLPTSPSKVRLGGGPAFHSVGDKDLKPHSRLSRETRPHPSEGLGLGMGRA